MDNDIIITGWDQSKSDGSEIEPGVSRIYFTLSSSPSSEWVFAYKAQEKGWVTLAIRAEFEGRNLIVNCNRDLVNAEFEKLKRIVRDTNIAVRHENERQEQERAVIAEKQRIIKSELSTIMSGLDFQP